MGNKKYNYVFIQCINALMIVCLSSALVTRAKVVQSWPSANPELKFNTLF